MPFGSRNEEALELAPVLGPRLSPIDGFLRDWRVRKAEPFIGPGVSVLDVGCYDGSLFKAYASRMARGVGIDPTLTRSTGIGRFRFIADRFPSDLIGDERFDVITMLAVLEHVDLSELPTWRAACERLLVPGGTLLLTVPAPQVDKIWMFFVRCTWSRACRLKSTTASIRRSFRSCSTHDASGWLSTDGSRWA